MALSAMLNKFDGQIWSFFLQRLTIGHWQVYTLRIWIVGYNRTIAGARVIAGKSDCGRENDCWREGDY